MLFLCLIDTIAFLCTIDLPMGVIYGPLTYLAYRSTKGINVPFTYLHIFPFLLFLFLFIILYFGKQFSIHWIFNIEKYYNYGYKIALPVSLFVYSIVVILERSSNHLLKAQFVKKIGIINVGSALFAALPVLKMIWPQITIGFDPSLAIYGFNGIIVFVTAYYLIFVTEIELHDVEVQSEKNRAEPYANTDVEKFKLNLHNCLLDSKLYLNGGLTLKMLAEKMRLPKHQLSYLLNTYFDKSFYRLIADYRVDYAKKRLDEDNFITIETLAYECGFNSKTSLNRYFKELTGYSPSQYRSGIISKQLSLR